MGWVIVGIFVLLLATAWIVIFRLAMRSPNKTSGSAFDPSGSWGVGTG